MRRVPRRSVALVVLLALVALPAVVGPASAASPISKHDRILAYWTKERIQSAKPRDFVRQPGGKFEPAKRPAPGGPGSGNTTGSLWPDGKGTLYRVVGRVLFTMDGGNWICSGVAATDARGDISVVVTAAHCAYDQVNKAFATNWMFFPEFDTTPSYTCDASVYGCWTADRLVVHSGFANQPGFTSTATLYDWAFAVTAVGGKAPGQQLDALGSFPIAFTSYGSGTAVTATGYPAGGKYSPGNELVYCSGGVAFDVWNLNRTYRLSCDMTGGSSGGPWLTSFATSGNTGTLSSLNSYTYSGGASMYGPKFNGYTQVTWNAAVGRETGNAVVP